jgi:hypothetical protein
MVKFFFQKHVFHSQPLTLPPFQVGMKKIQDTLRKQRKTIDFLHFSPFSTAPPKMKKSGENRSFFGYFSACGVSFSLAFGMEEG